MNRFRKNRGFTLVEIMIVVLVIGILLAIAVPNFIQAQNTGRRRTCLANLHQIETAKEWWAMDKHRSANDVPTKGELVPAYMGEMPSCPAGGVYSINAVSKNPTCTVDGHAVP